ncbi:MAG: PorT family protein [Bacteroidales bacterium]|jgi:hypothetical protein|nr:outer membrane beta-barrel protein [Bacteroidales bacterium]MDY2935563.1 outer membrane beta-barrel protein [Candidatus Cryptobacteroides sp.]MCH3940249.1 PorT family protein [Bacteroidales bacterium]MCI5719585.1 PorT family protein [Bacteroidales bacterium]MDD7089897.1 outer membrane beta-barrel protein [Bacteroidales bacterium]
MKKILTSILTISMVLAGTTAFAQASIGLGFLNSTDIMKDNIKDVNLNGFYVGADYNFALGTSGIGVAPGINYQLVTKSDSNLGYSGTLGKANIKGDRTQMFITVPVMFNYGFQMGDGLVGRFYAGPTMSVGVYDKIKSKTSGEILGIKFSSDDKTDMFDNDDYRRFDVMLGGGFALDCYDMVRFKVGYDYGLINRWDSDDVKNHRGQAYFGVAYLF